MQPVSTDAAEEGTDDRETEDDVSSETFISNCGPTKLNSPESASSHPCPVAANKPGIAHKAKKKIKEEGIW